MQQLRKLTILGVVASGLWPASAFAQEGNIVVTGSRTDYRYYDEEQSAIGLRVKADYFAQRIYVSSDSRDAEQRNAELKAMLRNAIEMASSSGIELVAGDFELTEVNLQNMDQLQIEGGGRPDTSRVGLYAQIAVSDAVATEDAAAARIKSFVDGVPVTGRSFIERGGVELTIINPDQYRDQVVREVAKASTRYAGFFGNDYGVEIRGLDSELKWTQVSENAVLLYIPHNFVIRPK